MLRLLNRSSIIPKFNRKSFRNSCSKHSIHLLIPRIPSNFLIQDKEILQLPEIQKAKQDLEKKNYNEAQFNLKRAIEVLSMSLGQNHRKIGYPVYESLIQVYLLQTNYSKAEELILENLNWSESQKDEEKIYPTMNQLVLCYLYQQKLEEAVGFSSLLVERAKSSNKWDIVAECILNMGISYYLQNSFNSAINCFQDCINILKNKTSQSKSKTHVFALNNLGSSYHRSSKSLESAGSFYETASNMAKQIEIDSITTGIILTNWGELELNKKNLKKAEELLEEAIKILQSQDYSPELIECLFQSAKLYEIQGNGLFAEGLYRKAQDILMKKKNFMKIAFSLGNSTFKIEQFFDSYITFLKSRGRSHDTKQIEMDKQNF